MKPKLNPNALAASISGAVFGAGLALSGMTKPSKVIGFLDVLGAWDPSLALVMVGAIAVHFIAYRFVLRRPAPFFAERWAFPSRRDIDAKLILGASIFGIGWGLAGYCPGPGIVSVPSLGASALVFTGALVAGILAAAYGEEWLKTRRSYALRRFVPGE